MRDYFMLHRRLSFVRRSHKTVSLKERRRLQHDQSADENMNNSRSRCVVPNSQPLRRSCCCIILKPLYLSIYFYRFLLAVSLCIAICMMMNSLKSFFERFEFMIISLFFCRLWRLGCCLCRLVFFFRSLCVKPSPAREFVQRKYGGDQESVQCLWKCEHSHPSRSPISAHLMPWACVAFYRFSLGYLKTHIWVLFSIQFSSQFQSKWTEVLQLLKIILSSSWEAIFIHPAARY